MPHTTGELQAVGDGDPPVTLAYAKDGHPPSVRVPARQVNAKPLSDQLGFVQLSSVLGLRRTAVAASRLSCRCPWPAG
jgi:hypothetical protein